EPRPDRSDRHRYFITLRAATAITKGLLPAPARPRGHDVAVAEHWLPRAKRGEHRVAGRVGLERRDRDEAAAHRVDVGELVAQPAVVPFLDPVVRLAARVEGLEDRALVLAPALHGAHGAEPRPRRHAHLQQPPLGAALPVPEAR